MKTLTCFLFIVFTVQFANAQDAGITEIPMPEGTDFKVLEPAILKNADFLLSTPVENTLPRNTAAKNIIGWMSGTPDFLFGVDEDVIRISKKNDDLMILYMAACARYAIQHASAGRMQPEMKINAFTDVITYCEKEDNHVKKTKALENAMKAKNESKLKEWFTAKP